MKLKHKILNSSHKGNNINEKASINTLENNVNNENMNEDNNNRFKDFFVKYRDSLYLIITFQLIIIYLEVVFHLLKFESINKYSILYILSALPAGGLLTVLTSIFNKITNKIITWFLMIGLSLIYCIQLVYHYVFKAFLSLYSVGAVGTDVLEFYDQIVLAILNNLPGLLLLILPLPILGFLMKKVLILKKTNMKMQGSLLVGSVIAHILFIIVLPVYGKEAYSPYDLYHNTWIQEMGIQQLGVLTSTRFDIEQLVFNKNHSSLEVGLILEPTPVVAKPTQIPKVTDISEIKPNITATPTPTPLPTPLPIDTSPNILEIDFAALEKSESDPDIKTMHQYFAASPSTNKNEYTGMFEGYNLILITAEGFSPYAVDEKVTPTLYKLTHEGFIFNNFYTPLWWASTSDGEYVATTSLIPKSGVISYFESGSNAMPFAFGTQFSKLGYSTRAYHNHTYTYYKRHISHPNMGYIYKGVGNGLEIKKSWPESDLEMMEVTIPEYIEDQPFHTYYMTVSGHMNYTFIGNSMSTKNKTAVEELPYSMEAKAYIACNVELDKALEKLLNDLEEKGIADKTVIALSADHYPYGLEKDKIDELAGHEVEENFELYRNHFILWSGSIKEPIIVDKVSSSLDIIPTLSNLFGLPYDSRLLMGQDILSDSAPLVMFSNRSFINDKVMYNSITKEVMKLTEEELPEDYIKTMNQIVNNKFLISKSILEEDYYNYVLPKDKAEIDQSDEDK
jgi:hypothetical protein